MQYTINKTNYCDFSIYKKNRLPRRSYFIPYPDKTSADAVPMAEKRYASPKAQCLNGDWDFAFYPRPKDVPDLLDTDAVSWGTMPVPGCWQFHGIDRPFYVNIRYQFPFNPPEIPKERRPRLPLLPVRVRPRPGPALRALDGRVDRPPCADLLHVPHVDAPGVG